MNAKPIPTWQAKLNAAIKQDPKRSAVLGVLVLVLAIVGGRAFIGTKANPPTVIAGPLEPGVSDADTSQAFKASGKKDSVAAMQRWLASPSQHIARNLFAVDLNYFPNASGKAIKKPNPDNPSDQDKSDQQHADELRERQKRLDALQLQAKQLKLQSTMMSATPHVLINGEYLKEGDSIANTSGDTTVKFRVIKIEPRRVILESDGVKLEILMK